MERETRLRFSIVDTYVLRLELIFQGPGSGGGPSSVGGLGVGNMVGGMVGAATDGSVVGGIGAGKEQQP